MLEPLFDAELDYRLGVAPLTGNGEGVPAGSGDGVISGPRLAGSREWTLFEGPGTTVCTMAPMAQITTGDGAQIRFEGGGYGTRPDPADPRWRVAATLRFTSSDSRHAWLNEALAVCEGEFNEAAHHARYQAFLQQAAPAADPPPAIPASILNEPAR